MQNWFWFWILMQNCYILISIALCYILFVDFLGKIASNVVNETFKVIFKHYDALVTNFCW